MSLAFTIPGQIGTAIPRDVPVIGLENYSQLGNVAHWGMGSIMGAAFAPSGEEFVVGSAYGFAVFDLDALGSYRWINFDAPFFYESMYFNTDGRYLLLESGEGSRVHGYPDGLVITPSPEITWLRDTTISREWGWATVTSPKGDLQLKCSVHHDEEYWDNEFSDRAVYNSQSGELLYTLPDETIQVTYWDRNAPQGCDLDSFSYCGNVYSPSADLPYRMGFSPSGDSISILYRPPNLWYSRYFGILRVYDAKNGSLLGSFGSFESPLETFAYSPDGKTILIANVDGSVHLLDVWQNEFTLNVWPFDAPISDLAYSYDGKFLIVQRGDTLEVQRVVDGAVVSRYSTNTFSVSPTNNHLALGDNQGNIFIHELDTGKLVFQVAGHKAAVYALAYSSDGRLLASTGQDCYGRIWNATTGEFLHNLEANRTNAYGEENTESRIFIYTLKFLPGTNSLIGSGSWGRVASWNIDSGATNYLIEPEPLKYWNGMMTLNPHFPEYFGVDVESGRFYINEGVYNLADGAFIGPYQYPQQTPVNCAPSGPVSRDGKIRFTIGLENMAGRICVLDARDNHLLDSFTVPAQYALTWPFLSPDGTQLIVTSDAGPIYVYQVISR